MQNRGMWLTGLVLGAAVVAAAPSYSFADDASELAALKARVAELEEGDPNVGQV